MGSSKPLPSLLSPVNPTHPSVVRTPDAASSRVQEDSVSPDAMADEQRTFEGTAERVERVALRVARRVGRQRVSGQAVYSAAQRVPGKLVGHWT